MNPGFELAFRPLAEVDEVLVAGLLTEAMQHRPLDVTGETAVDIAPLMEMVRSAPCFVAEVSGRGIGFISIRVYSEQSPRIETGLPPAAVITAIGVDRAFRRRGVGRALIDHALGWLRTRGIVIVTLNVAAPNRDAIAFYERAGFEVASYQFARTLSQQRTGE